MVDADHLDALVADLAQRIGGDDGGDPGGGDDAVDVAGVSGEIGVDLLFGGLGRVDVGDHLNDADGAVRFLGRLLHRVNAQLRVRIDEEAGEMRDAALAAHRLDQLLGAEIGRIAGVGAKAEQTPSSAP